MSKFSFSKILVVLAFLLTTKAYAIPVLWQVTNGSSLPITAFGVCKIVANASGATIIVDTHTSGNWSTFRSSPPSGVTVSDCNALTPTYIASGIGTQGGGANYVTVTNSFGVQVGDLILLMATDRYNFTGAAGPSGFTQIGPTYQNCPTGGTDYWGARFYKIATSTEVALGQFTVTRTGNCSECGLTVAIFRNVNPTNPIEAYANNNGTTGATITYATATAARSNSLSLGFAESCGSTPSVPSTYSANGDQSALYSRLSSKTVAAGATGTFTSTHTSAPWGSLHIILNPKEL